MSRFDKRQAISWFYPEPLGGRDYTNLSVSGVKRIQMFYLSALNLPRQLEELARMGVKVTLRLEEPFMVPIEGSYYDPLAWPAIRVGVQHIQRSIEVEAVISGNEPQHGYNLTWASRTWGNMPDEMFPNEGGRAVSHARGVAGITEALRGICKVVSPGWEHKRVRPQQEPQPGRMSWRELGLGAYNACHANGAHTYADDMVSPEDENRFLWAVGEEIARCHKAVWLNEVGVNKVQMSDLARMQAITHMGDLLTGMEWGGRVVSFTPFVSNGQPDEAWSHMIMDDPAAYVHLRNWLEA